MPSPSISSHIVVDILIPTGICYIHYRSIISVLLKCFGSQTPIYRRIAYVLHRKINRHILDAAAATATAKHTAAATTTASNQKQPQFCNDILVHDKEAKQMILETKR